MVGKTNENAKKKNTNVRKETAFWFGSKFSTQNCDTNENFCVYIWNRRISRALFSEIAITAVLTNVSNQSLRKRWFPVSHFG
jgi:hypothetical protein